MSFENLQPSPVFARPNEGEGSTSIWRPPGAKLFERDAIDQVLQADKTLRLPDVARTLDAGLADILESLYQIDKVDSTALAEMIGAANHNTGRLQSFTSYKSMRDAIEDLRNETHAATGTYAITIEGLADKLGRETSRVYNSLHGIGAIKMLGFDKPKGNPGLKKNL